MQETKEMNIDFFRWHEVPAVLWINAINWIMIMAKRLLMVDWIDSAIYIYHVINSICKVIDYLHGSLSEVLVSQCLVDLTQPSLIISTVIKFLAWIFYFPMLIFLRLKKVRHLSPQFHWGLASNDPIDPNLLAEKK